MRKVKDLETLAKEVEISSQPQPAEVIPAASAIQAAPTTEPKSSGPATKRKNPANDDDEGFITVQKKKGQAGSRLFYSTGRTNTTLPRRYVSDVITTRSPESNHRLYQWASHCGATHPGVLVTRTIVHDSTYSNK
ncbi:hypothetical protein CEXT_94661 [Caerostris extrusa]|uniref:Uncharacterized protein n=1 Tax=Caerostris extrusa TaxID=172846 RepID=A0AAV4NR02_CAEEX|nr:hypothetical protein CEXT_94661 [Caerostris extrusa]